MHPNPSAIPVVLSFQVVGIACSCLSKYKAESPAIPLIGPQIRILRACSQTQTHLTVAGMGHNSTWEVILVPAGEALH